MKYRYSFDLCCFFSLTDPFPGSRIFRASRPGFLIEQVRRRSTEANGLRVTKDVFCEKSTSWTWNILKSVNQSSLTLSTVSSRR